LSTCVVIARPSCLVIARNGSDEATSQSTGEHFFSPPKVRGARGGLKLAPLKSGSRSNLVGQIPNIETQRANPELSGSEKNADS
jgi:hypothetical protein